MSEVHFSEQEMIRREKLAKLQAAGIDPFPAPLYAVNSFSTDIKNNYTEEKFHDFSF